MSISGITVSSGALSSSVVQSLLSQPQTAGAAASFGPAYVLSGSTSDFVQGLYNSVGSLIGANPQQLAAATSAAASVSNKQRNATLESAAAKIDNGDPQGGRAQAQELLSKNADDVTALRLVARSYLVEQDYENAERSLARASALAPDNARVRGDLANVRALQKSDEEVLAKARRKVKSPSHRAEGLRLLLHLSDRSPKSADVYLALADGFDTRREPVQVIGALQEALRFADERQVNQVIARAKTLASLHPEAGLPHNLLGRALQKAGRVNESISELEAATNLVPENFSYATDLAGAYIARAQAKLASGDLTSAEADVRAAENIDRSHSGLNEVTARVAAGRAERDIARGSNIGVLSKLYTAYSKAPDDVSFRKKVAALYSRVAAHFQSQGSDAQALSSYIKAYELDPTSQVARRNIGPLSWQRGLDATSRKDYDTAIEHLDRAYQTDRGNATYKQDLATAHDLRGQEYVTDNELDKAIEDFKQAYRLDPSNASIEANLASAVKQNL